MISPNRALEVELWPCGSAQLREPGLQDARNGKAAVSFPVRQTVRN